MMRRLTTNIVTLGMAACITLVIAGCGGGGAERRLETENADLVEQLAAQEAVRKMAEEEAAAAEAAKILAEEEAAAAEAAKILAEEEAAAAEAAKILAEEEAEAAAAAKILAEEEAAAAEAAKILAEEEAAAAEAAKILAEEEAEAAEAAKKLAEDEAAAAEAAKKLAEEEAAAAEEAKELAEADEQAAEAARQAAARALEEAQQQAQTQEANQRADKLKKEFPGGDFSTPLPAISQSDSPVTVTARSGSLRLTRGGHSPATLSGAGVRTATMSLTSGGDAGKTVVYTDWELSRPLLEHFGDWRDSTDMTRFDVGLFVTPHALPNTIPQTSMQWRITHQVSTSVATDNGSPPADAVAAKTATSYAGSLYGKPGRFVCGGTDDCQVQVMPTYADDAVSGRHALQSVAVTAAAGTGGGSPDLYFKPSGSQTLELYTGGPVGADSEYMVYGYWREDPTSPAADYHVGVFAQAFNTGTASPIPGTFTATYDGTAVGMYVEQDPNNAVDTHRQGEFTADVFLEVDSAASDLSGTIDDFVTTPTDGSAAPRTSARWVVRLRDEPDTDNNAATAVIENLTGIKSGSWEHTFVQAHQYATDNTPPAVTGTFNTRILDFVHLLGAFGAEKR